MFGKNVSRINGLCLEFLLFNVFVFQLLSKLLNALVTASNHSLFVSAVNILTRKLTFVFSKTSMIEKPKKAIY